MAEEKIKDHERTCIADCIRDFWGAESEHRNSDTRDKDYEECLNNCQVCG